jgi:hypothetical protein
MASETMKARVGHGLPNNEESSDNRSAWYARIGKVKPAALMPRRTADLARRSRPAAVTVCNRSSGKRATLSPTRRSRTVRCKCHAGRPYQPFRCAVHPTARKGMTGPADHRLLAGLARRSRLRRVRDEEAAGSNPATPTEKWQVTRHLVTCHLCYTFPGVRFCEPVGSERR